MGAKVHKIMELQHPWPITHMHSWFVNLRDQDADDSWRGCKASLAVTRLVGQSWCSPSTAFPSPWAGPLHSLTLRPRPQAGPWQPPNSSHTENCPLPPWLLNLGWVGVELGLLVPLFLNLHSGFSWSLPPIGVKLDLGSSLHSLEGTWKYHWLMLCHLWHPAWVFQAVFCCWPWNWSLCWERSDNWALLTGLQDP